MCSEWGQKGGTSFTIYPAVPLAILPNRNAQKRSVGEAEERFVMCHVLTASSRGGTRTRDPGIMSAVL